MQKTKTARVATKGKTSSAGKTGKTKQTAQTKQTKTRKPLTPEQRERKNAHDRAVRAAKRKTANNSDKTVQKQPVLRKGQIYSLERALPLKGALPVPVGTVFTIGEYLDSVEKFDFGIGGTDHIPQTWIEGALRAGCLYLVDDPNPEAIADPQKRAIACAKADAAERDRVKKVCSRPGEVCVPETPCNAGRAGCSTGMQGLCGGCGPSCCNYEKCRHLARTEGFPRLHRAEDAVEAANREAAAQPTQPVRAVEPVRGRSTPRPANPIAAIGAWVRTNLARLEQTKGTGIVRQTFNLPDGVAEVAVSRKACELPCKDTDAGLLRFAVERIGDFVSDCSRYMLRTGRPVPFGYNFNVPGGFVRVLASHKLPEPWFRNCLCGMDFGHPSALDRVWDGVSAAVDRDWAAIKAGSAE